MLRFAIVLRLTTENLAMGYTVIPYLEHQTDTVLDGYTPHLHGFATQLEAEAAGNSLVGIVVTDDHLTERQPVADEPTADDAATDTDVDADTDSETGTDESKPVDTESETGTEASKPVDTDAEPVDTNTDTQSDVVAQAQVAIAAAVKDIDSKKTAPTAPKAAKA